MDIQRPDLKLKRLRRRWLIVGGILMLIAGTAWGLTRLQPAAPSASSDKLWLDTVKRGDFIRQVRGPGTLVPREIRWIPATSEGRIERVLVKPGARVSADTVVVEMSNPDLIQQAEEARWQSDAAAAEQLSNEAELQRELLDAKASLAEVEADYESARLQAEAEGELEERNIISNIQFRQTQLKADQLKTRRDLERQRLQQLRSSIDAQLAAGKARVEQARQRYARRQQQVEQLVVKAGIDGVLQALPVEPGQQLRPGENIARVARPDDLIAELRIPETQARDLRLDQHATIDTRNGEVDGRVMRIDPAVSNGTVQVDVEPVAALPAGARPDLSVDGTITIEHVEDALYVGRPASGQPNTTVTLFRVAEDGYGHQVQVQLGRASVNLMEIVSGLEAGDRIILSDTSNWNDSERIRLQ